MVEKELSMQKLNEQIDKLVNIIVKSILGAKSKEEPSVLTLWPLPTTQGVLYWGEEWAKKLNQVLHLIEEQGISDKDIKEYLKFPSKIVHFLWRCGDAVKNSGLTKEEKLFMIKKLFEILSIFRKENLFCENGKNMIWDKKELEIYEKNLYWFSGENKKLNQLISNFKASLYLYTELLYWAQHPLGHCFHGPYPEKQGDLLIKEYFDLKPKVWPFSQVLNFSGGEIFEIYKKGTAPRIKLEFFERGIQTTKSLKQDLKKFALRVDKKTIKKAKEISQFLENLMEVIKKGGKVIQSLNTQQMIEKHADYWFYALKPLYDLVQEDWHPPKQVRDNIYKRYEELDVIWKEMAKERSKMAGLPYKEQVKILKEEFDPRK